MARSTLSAGLRHRLIQQLAAKQRRSHSAISQGFTLIELLVVVIIVGILAAVALPGFLSQSDKAKASSAKAMVTAAVKECQVYLVDATVDNIFTQQTDSTNEIVLAPAAADGTCVAGQDNAWTATIQSNLDTYTATLLANGTTTQTCATVNGPPELCVGGTW